MRINLKNLFLICIISTYFLEVILGSSEKLIVMWMKTLHAHVFIQILHEIILLSITAGV